MMKSWSHTMCPLSLLKFCSMKPLTTSFMKPTPTISYHNLVRSYSLDAFFVMSPRTQFSVLMIICISCICGMGNPLSPVLANIFMAKLEADVVRPFNPPFYDRYVDDCFSKKKKDEPDALFERLNRYHPNIVNVFTVEENPGHFLDTAFSYTNKFNCSVFKKPGKLPTHWKSEAPIKWKRNCIIGALHRAKRISTDFEKDIKTLETSLFNAGYPKRFIMHTINNFLNNSSQDDNIIPNFLFEERKQVFIKLPFCGRNEKLSKTFIAKLNKFTNFNFIFIILWQTREINSLFNNKDKNTYRSKVVYKGDCSCGVDYIGETVRNLVVRIAEHSSTLN